MPFSSLKSTFEIIMQLNCVWMFWHSECESWGPGSQPRRTLTVMSSRAGSSLVSFIILSTLGYCKPPPPRLLSSESHRQAGAGASPALCAGTRSSSADVPPLRAAERSHRGPALLRASGLRRGRACQDVGERAGKSSAKS